MDDMKKRIDIIEQTVVQEQVERYGKGVSKMEFRFLKLKMMV